MGKTVKIIIGTGVLATIGILVWSKVNSLKDFMKNLIISVGFNGNINNIKLTLSTLTLPLKIDFANRSDQSITLGLNALDLIYTNKIVAQNSPSANEVTIKPYTVSTLPITVNMSTLNLIAVGGDIVRNAINDFAGGKITFDKVITQLNGIISKLSIQLNVVINRSISYGTTIKLGESEALAGFEEELGAPMNRRKLVKLSNAK
jgi:hypothetical protein